MWKGTVMDIKIMVAAHKKYWMPADSVYFPLQVGAEGKKNLGYLKDNSGENISIKNPNYCELTGMYWAWKNLHTDYIGLCHYRRYFAHKNHVSNLEEKHNAIMTEDEYRKILQDYDCILPKRRNYYIETVRSQYEHAHNKHDLDMVEQIIKEMYPEYSTTFTTVMNRRRLHIFNMFVMKWNLFDAYCQFLFDVLFALEKRIDINQYDQYEARVFGFISERLLNVWIEKNKIRYKEVPVVFLEQVNWLDKGSKFLKRKVVGRK